MTAFAIADASTSAQGTWGAMTEYLLCAVDTALSGHPLGSPAAGVLLEQAIRTRDESGTVLAEHERPGAVMAVLLVAGLVGPRQSADVGGTAVRLLRRFESRWGEVLPEPIARQYLRDVHNAVCGSAPSPVDTAMFRSIRAAAPAVAALRSMAAEQDHAFDDVRSPDAGAFRTMAQALWELPDVAQSDGRTIDQPFRRSEISLSVSHSNR